MSDDAVHDPIDLDATYEPDPDPEPSPSHLIGVDLRSTGGYACATPSGMLVLAPGFNAVASAIWSAAEGNKSVASRLESGTLSIVDLDTVFGDALVDLAGRTRRRDMLEFLIARERAKPLLGGRLARRNNDVLAALRRQLTKV